MMIYIMIESLLSRKMSTSYLPELSAGGAKLDARQVLPAIGRLWPRDDDYDNDNDDDDDDDGNGDDDDNLFRSKKQLLIIIMLE